MGRFQPGNVAAIGNKGGGRPRKALRDLMSTDAPKVWGELTRIAFDDTHTLHRRHAFEALRTLAQFTFPRPQAVVLETSDDGDASTMIAHFVQVATARLDQRRRDAERNGACIACGHSGVSTELEVATTIPAGDGTETGRSLDDSGGVRFVVHRDGRARAARTR